MTTDDRIDVSVLVPVLDEEDYIVAAVDAMRAQHGAGTFELLFMDGRSTDATRAILERIAAEDARVRVFDNPERRTPQGLNIGLRNARGRFVARMDAHTHYPSGYLAAGIERLERGGADWVSGPQLAYGVDTWSRRVALALSTLIGTGGASFRRAMESEIEVDTGFTGVWRRETLERYGGWDERWPVDQDYELAARMRADGARIVCIPAMAARYIPRNSIRRLVRQYWRYGEYRVKTSVAHPASMRRSHVLPPGLAVAVAMALGAAPRPLRTVARLALGVYAIAIAAAAVEVRDKAPPADVASLPLVFAAMHLAAGFGFLSGCVRFGPPLAAIANVLRSVAPGTR